MAIRRHQPVEEPETDPNAEAKAVALRYDMERDKAPRVVAKGRGYVAENIMAAAQQNTIPVYQNKTLVNMLMAIDIDREIPPELYRAIAEVMAYVYRIDQRAKERRLAREAAGRG
ncbi:MAG: EscU/YscU/HrcU family type III secretion system export apparatus switch protein [Selenomonas sp.]|nr:EscU/YscU/HrcU family type III secretion system export apparatus switch protein [Selenomonas sp.]